MNVESHHVAGAAVKEECVGAYRDRLVDVAFHEPELLEAGGDGSAGEQMDVAVGHAGGQISWFGSPPTGSKRRPSSRFETPARGLRCS